MGHEELINMLEAGYSIAFGKEWQERLDQDIPLIMKAIDTGKLPDGGSDLLEAAIMLTAQYILRCRKKNKAMSMVLN